MFQLLEAENDFSPRPFEKLGEGCCEPLVRILAVGARNQAPLNTTDMFRAIGFGITLIIIKVMMPEVFTGLEHTLIKLFQVLGDTLGQFPNNMDQTAMIYPHAVFPQ